MPRLPRAARALVRSCTTALLCCALPVEAGQESEAERSLSETPPPAETESPEPESNTEDSGSPGTRGETRVKSTHLPKPLLPASRVGSEVTREELSRRPARSTPEALLEEEGVFLQRTNHAGGAPVIRGLLGHQVLILVDGVRLNNAITRAGPNQSLNTIDPFLIERLEVVRVS